MSGAQLYFQITWVIPDSIFNKIGLLFIINGYNNHKFNNYNKTLTLRKHNLNYSILSNGLWPDIRCSVVSGNIYSIILY